MPQFDPVYTARFYDAYGTRESTRWQRQPRLKMQYALLCHYLRERIKPGDRVLDAGSGPGTFAKELLALDARVTCLDLSPVQLEACRKNASGCEAYELGSVTDLRRFADRSFDVSLAFGGVLSYCFEQVQQGLRELVRVTRPNGLIGITVMSLYGSMHCFLPQVLALPAAVNGSVIATGDLSREVN